MPLATENVTVRMRPEASRKLEKIAADLDRSRNWLINQAIELYLDLHDWQAAKIRERLQEAKRGGEFVPHDEVMQRVAATIAARSKA